MQSLDLALATDAMGHGEDGHMTYPGQTKTNRSRCWNSASKPEKHEHQGVDSVIDAHNPDENQLIAKASGLMSFITEFFESAKDPDVVDGFDMGHPATFFPSPNMSLELYFICH
jgi:hypothetical protein